ncbi:DUF3144 domain-containing protein [Aurantivibrio plasticivorans]
MNDNQPDQEFWDLADSFINMANEQMEHSDPGKVSSAILYAAARFNAFIVANTTEEDFESEKAGALRYFTKQYRVMLEESLEDFEREQ